MVIIVLAMLANEIYSPYMLLGFGTRMVTGISLVYISFLGLKLNIPFLSLKSISFSPVSYDRGNPYASGLWGFDKVSIRK